MRLQAVAVVVCLAAGCGGGSGPVPPGWTTEVANARTSLEQNWEGIPVPAFDFVAVRCRTDGGVLIQFNTRAVGASGVAYAMQGPGAVSDAWSGGFGVADPATDPEITRFFEESPEARCPR